MTHSFSIDRYNQTVVIILVPSLADRWRLDKNCLNSGAEAIESGIISRNAPIDCYVSWPHTESRPLTEVSAEFRDFAFFFDNFIPFMVVSGGW